MKNSIQRLAALLAGKNPFLLLKLKMAGRLLQFCRRFSTNQALRGSSLSEPLTATAEPLHEGDYKKWRSLFFFVCLPICVIYGFYVTNHEEKPRPKFVKYSHLRIRNKVYPWRDGVKTLFHGHNNALPDGYEDEIGGH